MWMLLAQVLYWAVVRQAVLPTQELTSAMATAGSREANGGRDSRLKM